ncbi:hypothetical protein [Rhodococcus sp. GXMU-t2271]|uniref:hypothetical protein n=1 Tax=Rhodococcus TaxID=1827 RepID=UPI00352A9134
MDEPFFSWNRRRMILHTNGCPVPGTSAGGAEFVSDVPLTVGTRRGRLITVVVDDDEYVALVVGDVRRRHDVPVRRVVAEGLLIEGSRSRLDAEILLPVSEAPVVPVPSVVRRIPDPRSRYAEAVQALLAYSGARSVTVEFAPASLRTARGLDRSA